MPDLTQTIKLFRGGPSVPVSLRRAMSLGPSHLLAVVLFALGILTASEKLHAQATVPTASRQADLQVGVTYSGAEPDYSPQRFYGLGGYVTYDFMPHFGVEINVRQVTTTGNNKIYERTYEIGGRYVLRYDRYNPYFRANIGRGVFNFPNNVANLAYNMYALGGGVDVNVIPAINVRADFEYQSWPGFPPHGLQPMVGTVGVAYRFH